MSVQAPADKRFRRAHVAPTRRRTLWPPDWKLVAGGLAVLVLLAYAGYRGISWVMGDDALVIQRITVEGNVRMSAGEVTALLDGLRGQNMLTADLESWKTTLKASPWVSDVAFRRVFPGRIAVAVIERTPIGIARLGDSLFLVDRHGNLIDEYGPNYAALDLPLVTGLDGGTPGDAPQVDQLRASLAVKVVDAVSTRRDLAARVSEIDVTDAHNAVLTLKDDPTLVRLGDDQFVHRLQTYLDLVPTLRERVPGADYADVRFENRVYVRPAGAAMPAPGLRTVAARVTAPAPAPAPAVAASPDVTRVEKEPKGTKGKTPAKAQTAKARKKKGRRR